MKKSFRAALESGAPQVGLCIMYPSPGVVERIGPDWDWIWIDGQHGELGYQDALALVRACDLVERSSFVRVPAHERGHIGLALDMGATGVIVPQVNTPAEAKAVALAAKLPPLGERSYGGRRPIDLLGRAYSDTANAETLLVVQIESPEAIANAEAIAAVPGVDALFLGPDDVMLRRGYSMTQPRTKDTLDHDMQAMVAACRNQGKFSCTVGIGEMFTACLDWGISMIVGGGDVAFLAGTSKQASAEVRALIRGHKPSGKPATGVGLYG
jgi:4-hydroxy-2-oxoheptanedioate aldolase